MNPPCLAIVLPCYNEQEVLPLSIPTLLELMKGWETKGLIAPSSYILCVDDCSRDNTWQVIEDFHRSNPAVRGITFAHNSGQQNALLAGLFTVMDHCDCVVTLDADLQDDPAAIEKMLNDFENGSEIVYGVRSSRDSDTWFKRTTARGFYKFQRAMGVELVYDHSDFRLMSNRALHLLEEYGERNIFLRNLVPRIGLKTSVVTYPRAPRLAGETKYPLSKMLAFSIDGITSFTARPMRYIFMIGLCLVFVDIIIAAWALISYFTGDVVSGWTSLILSVWFLGGLILMGIGIVGEYIGKIFEEVKHRPRYAIRKSLFD